MDEEMIDSDVESICCATGTLAREGTTVSVTMAWHMAHTLSASFQKEFLKYRCRDLQTTFGDLKGVRGLLKKVRVNKLGLLEVSDKNVISHMKNCDIEMGFMWPNVDDSRWEELKNGFLDVFAFPKIQSKRKDSQKNPLGRYEETVADNFVVIRTEFKLADKVEGECANQQSLRS